MSKAKDKPLKFEEALAEVESIIERIEAGEVGLEESLSQFERGMTLIAQCRAILATAEKKIAELSVDAAGKLRVESDDVGDNDVADADDADKEQAK
jgi:exodeoxyribonuclease VII small subunit